MGRRRQHLAVVTEGEAQHAGAKLVLKIRRVEPGALQRVAPLADGHLEDGHAAGAKEAEGADLSNHAGHFAGSELADAARIQAIFIAEWQVVEQILDGADALFQQNFGKARADAFDILDAGREFEHRDDGKSIALRHSRFARHRQSAWQALSAHDVTRY